MMCFDFNAGLGKRHERTALIPGVLAFEMRHARAALVPGALWLRKNGVGPPRKQSGAGAPLECGTPVPLSFPDPWLRKNGVRSPRSKAAPGHRNSKAASGRRKPKRRRGTAIPKQRRAAASQSGAGAPQSKAVPGHRNPKRSCRFGSRSPVASEERRQVAVK